MSDDPNKRPETATQRRSVIPIGPSEIPGDDPSLPKPIARLVALLPDETEDDLRFGARRRGERIPFCKPLSLRKMLPEPKNGPYEGDDLEVLFDAWAINVSHGGMRIVSEEQLVVGQVLELEVNSSGVEYRGRARISWVRTEPDGVIAGIEFTHA